MPETTSVEPATAVALDASQRAVIALGADESAVVLGAPGSGKTTTLVEFVADRIARGLEPDRLLVLAGSRQAATALRDRLAARIAVVTHGPLARTMPSFAYAVLSRRAMLAGAPPPQLLTGAEQDRILAAMLAGHADDEAAGTPSGPEWPEHLHAEVRMLAGFRAELRELLEAAAERGLDSGGLRRMADENSMPAWTAAADFLDELARILRLERRDASVVTAAALLRRAAGVIGSLPAEALPTLVVIDDAQELTEGSVVLLEALRARGATVVAFGDPDVATGGFRGADASLLAALPARLRFAGGESSRLLLSTVHRHGTSIRAFALRSAERIGTAGAGMQRVAMPSPEAESDGTEPDVRLLLAGSAEEEARLIARVIFERRSAGVPHGQIAVVARTGRIASDLAGLLASLDVPVEASGPVRLRDVTVVEALVSVLAIASGRAPLTAEAVDRLLRGDLIGLDAVAVRRLKRALRHRIIDSGREVHSPGSELVRDAIETPELLDGLARAGFAASAARRLSRMIAIAREMTERSEPAAVNEVLWSIWSAAGVADEWREQALEGSQSERALANRRLDAVVALFDQVRRLIERRPDLDTAGFVDSWLASSIDDDSLAARSAGDRVSVGTPSGLLGREVDTVIVAAVQEGVWPNLRPRGSLLGAARLGGEATDDDRLAVLHDELRTFHKAITASRARVVLTAVENADEQPSSFVAELTPSLPGAQRWHSVRSLVAYLRRRLVTVNDPAAAAALKRLADSGVTGADPADWAGLAGRSTDERLDQAELVRISPSSLQSLDDCELAWVIDKLAGSSSGRAAAFGTIVHEAVEHSDATDAVELAGRIERRLPELAPESVWEAEQQRAEVAPIAAALAEYFQRLRGEGWTIDASAKEARFTIPVGEAVLSGSIDWIERHDDGRVRVVDLKTGKHPPGADPELGNLQLRAYQLAVVLGAIEGIERGAATEARLVMPRLQRREKTVASDPFDPVADSFRRHLERAVETMGGSSFSAIPAGHCRKPFSFGQCRIHVVPEVTE